jgi:hypothetical protein
MIMARAEKNSTLSDMPSWESFTSFKLRISARLNPPKDPENEDALEWDWKAWAEPVASYQPLKAKASSISGLMAIVLEVIIDSDRPEHMRVEFQHEPSHIRVLTAKITHFHTLEGDNGIVLGIVLLGLFSP